MLDCVRKEGKVAHIGWANDLPPLPVIPIMAKTLTIFGLDDIAEAFAVVASKRGGSIKVIVTPDPIPSATED